MRASLGAPHEAGGRHVSGAERLVPASELEATVLELLRRARGQEAAGEHVRLAIDPVTTAATAPCLQVTTIDAPDPASAHEAAAELLGEQGVSRRALWFGYQLLTEGARGSGEPMRGAALIDAETGARLDPDERRGVRASRFDYAPELREPVYEALRAAGLGHFRTAEALAVATKVLWSGVLAEYCWSDDPEYAAGYVATLPHGYVRFPAFKPAGAVGGRLFFLSPGTDVAAIIDRLERAALLITTLPAIRSIAWPPAAGVLR
jgi:6-carboxyhexanoate--CoA ligase